MVSIVFAIAFVVGVCSGASVPGPSRIFGGSPTTVLEYPSIVQVDYHWPGYYWSQYCGGSILTNNIVLSAAHCYYEDAHNYRVRAGATVRERGGVLSYISSILIHPYYRDESVPADADICIIRLRDHLSYTDIVRNIAIIPQNWEIPGNSPGIYAGWGQTENEEVELEVLLHVDVNILSHEECERRYEGPIHQDVVCAGYDGKDACFGDSGGPLYYGGVLAGVIAWGPDICGHPYLPGAAIRVSAYTNWIVANQ